MKRRSFLLSAALPFAAMALFTAFSVPAAAERIGLTELSRYLNALTTAEADFTQINSDGTISTGKLFIHRPGRVRFEYAPPDASLVMAGGGQVAIFDEKSNQPPTQYPLSRTPLSIILARDVNLAQANMVVGHFEEGPTTRVRVQDPENPDYGSIELVFTPGPTELRQWIIRDESGSETTVILGEMKKDVKLASSLFNIVVEADKRKR
jgi:outer membrane lipoprotein-sorting protein